MDEEVDVFYNGGLRRATVSAIDVGATHVGVDLGDGAMISVPTISVRRPDPGAEAEAARRLHEAGEGLPTGYVAHLSAAGRVYFCALGARIMLGV